MKMNQGTHTILLSAIRLGMLNNVLSGQNKAPHNIFNISELRAEANMQHFPYLLRQSHDTVSDEDWQAYTDAVCYIVAADISRQSGEHPNVLTSRVVFPLPTSSPDSCNCWPCKDRGLSQS
jgi:hypothetical protein